MMKMTVSVLGTVAVVMVTMMDLVIVVVVMLIVIARWRSAGFQFLPICPSDECRHTLPTRATMLGLSMAGWAPRRRTHSCSFRWERAWSRGLRSSMTRLIVSFAFT